MVLSPPFSVKGQTACITFMPLEKAVQMYKII